MTTNPSIYFFCPDLDIPSGGINVIYRLAETSAAAGYSCFVMHQKKGFRNHYVPHNPQFGYWEDGLNFKAGDVVVIPETEPAAMKQLPDSLRKVVLSLSWSYIFENIPKGESWRDYGIRQVLTNSGVVADFINWSMAIDVHELVAPVDHDLFYFDPANKKPLLAYMAHRNNQGELVEKIFSQLPREVPRWEWIGINNMSIDAYAEVLRRATFFVTTGLREGRPGPILDAMAAGCVVVGYGGVGGNQYIVPDGSRQNAFKVENHDYRDLAKMVEKVLHMAAQKSALIDQVRDNGIQTAKPLTFEAERASLLTFWETLLAQ